MAAFDNMELPELQIDELSTVRPWLLDANNSPPAYSNMIEESTCFTANFFKRSEAIFNGKESLTTFTFENSELSSAKFESPFQALTH